MADLLQSQFSPVGGLRSAFRTDAEENTLAQLQMAEDAANSSAFGQGSIKGMHQTPALIANTLGQVVEPFSPQFSKPIFDWAANENRTAQSIYSPAPASFDQVNGLGDAASLAAGAFGENLPQIPLTIGSAIAARFGLRNVAMNPWLKTGAGAMAGSLPMNMGENVQSVRDDPVAMANSTPMERLGKTFTAAVPQAALDSVADTLLMGRATGLGKTVSNVFKDGLGKTAKDAALHIGKAVPEAALTEGLPEAGQELIKQQLMTNLNPERNKSGDEHALLDSFFKGWAAGAPSSAVGRGTDVAWAQGRGATEAIRGLLTPKRLPESLTLSSDKDILNWDAQDNEQRNNWAKGLADNIMNSDASQGMKEAAQGFYEKMASGAKNAWAGLSEAVGAEDKVARGRESLDRFFSSVKKANEAVGKANAEADPIDQDLYNNFAQHLDPKGAAARDTELKSRLFNTVKESLVDGDWQHLPWHELEDEFGTIGRATNAVVKLRENLVRAGQLEHDDEFGSLFEATIKEGQAGERAMMDVVKRYGREYINRDPSDSELRDTVRNIRKMLMNPEFMRKNKDAIDRQMAKAFGSEANAAKVLAALSPKNNVEAGIETEVENVDDTTGQTFKGKSAEEFSPGTRFIGSGVKGLRKQVASDEPGQNIVSNHGGFWPLGHSDEKTRDEIQGRFKGTAADLRKDGYYVRELTPLQYAAEAGVSVKKVATHILGRKAVSGMSDAEIAAALKDHPARMLAVDERDMEKDKLSLDNDDLLNLADKLKQSFSAFDKGMPMRDEAQRKQVAAALAKSGAEQRKAMKELGLEHGTKLRMGKGGAYLENNPRHAGNGVFNVHMADGTVRRVSAQHLIATMRERGRGQFSSRSAYDMFNSGIAALMNIDGVQKITTNDVWGREDDKPFDLKKGKNGKFKNYFQLEPGLNLGDAQRAARRGEFKDKVMEQLEAAYAAAEQSGDQEAIEEAQLAIDEELARRDALQDTLEGEGEREATPGSRSATDDDTVTPGDHARETPLDFNDDGTPKHPYGRDVSRSTENVAFSFNGVEMRVRPGVAGKHFTDNARKVMAVAKALQKIKNSPTATNSRMDMALDLVARSAAAQKDGNAAARDAAIFAAADAIRQAALDEIEVAQNEGNEEAVNKLTTAAAKVIDLAAQYDPDTHDALLADYKPYRSKGGASQDTRTPAQVQREKAEAQKAEVIQTTPQPIIQSKTTDPLQKARDDLQGKKDAAQAMADEAKARAAADQAWMDLSEEERTERVSEATKPVEQELTNLAKLNRSWGGLVKAVRQALRTLKQAWVNGELDRAELVKNLREAVSALKAVAGDVANVLRDAVNATIRAYKEADAKYSTLFSSYVDKGKAAFKKLLGVEENQAPASTEDKLLQRAAKRFAGQFKTGMEIKPHESGLGPLGSYTTRMFEKDGQLVFMAVPDSLVKDVIDKFAADKGMDVEQVTTLMQNTMQQTPETGLPMSPFISTYNLSSNYLMVSSALDGSPAEALMRKHGVLDQTKGASGKVWNKFKNLGPIPTANLLGEFFARIQKHTGNDNITITRNRDTGGAAEHGKGKKKTSVFEKSDHSGKYDLNSPAVQKLVSDFHDVADEYLEGGKYESEEHVISDAKYRTLIGSGLLFQYNVRQHYALKATNTKKTLAIVKGFLLSRGLDVKSTEFIVHESHNKASGFYDPTNNIISYSAQTLHHLAQEELTQEKVEALSTLIHEASHKVDLSMTLNGQTIAATEFNTALNADGAHRAEIEALHNSGKYGAFFEYPLNYESKMSEGLMKVELFAQANALYHTVGDEMKSLAPSLFKYLKGVNDAKTLRDQRAAIANTGQSGEEFEKDIGRLSSDAGDVFGTLENRGTDADRQGSRGAVHSEQVKHNAEGSFAATHNSPIRHSGKFDWRKNIGKGEGHASFGAGTYLSTDDKVHETYKKTFSETLESHKTQLANLTKQRDFLAKRLNEVAESTRPFVQKELDRLNNELSEANLLDTSGYRGDIAATYRVNVNISPDHLLDWDAPINTQGSFVQKALAETMVKLAKRAGGKLGTALLRKLHDRFANGTATGASVYTQLATMLGSQEKASDYLQDLGILGHKYAANNGENSAAPNYVIYDDSRIETNYVQFNAEGSFASGKGVTQAEFDAVKDYIGKVLGPKVKTMLVKDLGGNSAAWNRVSGETIIRIAANAANPLSKAHHEAMHEFFQRLMDAHPEAAEVLRTAADAPMVKRQIEQFFHNDANYAKIKAAIANDEHERVAYMFQLWAAGKLNVGPKTKNWFQKIKEFFQKAFGLLSNDQKAEAIMQAFHDGKMSEPSAVAEVLANDPKMVQGFLDRAGEWAAPIASKAKEALFTAQNILSESGNKGFQDIGKLFSTETGALAQEMSFMDAKVMKTNQMNDRVWAILKNADEKDIAAALEGLQRGETSKDADIAKLQGRLRTFLDQAHDYATKAGMDLKKVKDYFPRVWDPIAIAENKDKFVSMLQADHLAETGKPLSDTIAKGIATNLIANRGHEPVNEDELANGYSPFMAAANKRVLDFIKNPEFSEFQEKSMESILTTYIAQLVHKAEYTRRFGTNGDKLRDMVIDAVGEEVGPEWAAAKQAAQKRLDDLKKSYKGKPRAELTKKLAEMGYRYGGIEINHVYAELQGVEAKRKFSNYEGEMRRNIRAIMAMEGTLGADINPDIRKWSAGLIVYENMRLLGMSLFSQVIDPLGVMVRGGTVSNAWDTFKRGIAGTIAGWRGKPIDDSATRLAMQLGIIDAGGWMNSQGNAYTSLYMGKTAQKWNDRLFRFNGVEGFSQGTRVGAMTAAIEFLKHHSSLPSEHSERWLSELGLKQADVKLTNGELDYSNPKIQQAIFRWVEGAILRPNASMRPSWASDPHFALLFHLKQFTYAMQKVLLERVFNEAKHGNMDPGITMVLTYVPTMIAADFLRGLVANGGKEPPWKRNWTFGDYLAEGVQRAGLLGVPQFALDTAKWGPAELAGPVAEQLTKTGKTFYKDIKKDAYLDEVAGFTQAKRDIDRAAQFDGVEHAVKKTLRDALPINSLTKRYVYDEVVGK